MYRSTCCEVPSRSSLPVKDRRSSCGGFRPADQPHDSRSDPGFLFLLAYHGHDSVGDRLGYLVEEIEQVGDQPNLYWQFVINGEVSEHGIDQVTLSQGDAVSFTYAYVDDAGVEGHRSLWPSTTGSLALDCAGSLFAHRPLISPRPAAAAGRVCAPSGGAWPPTAGVGWPRWAGWAAAFAARPGRRPGGRRGA